MDYKRKNLGSKRSDTIYKLSKQWSDREGNFVFSLTELAEYENGERCIVAKYDGDYKWAQRVADYHDIKLPEEDN